MRKFTLRKAFFQFNAKRVVHLAAGDVEFSMQGNGGWTMSNRARKGMRNYGRIQDWPALAILLPFAAIPFPAWAAKRMTVEQLVNRFSIEIG